MDDIERKIIIFSSVSILAVVTIFGMGVYADTKNHESEVKVEAIKAGLHQDSNGHWVKSNAS